jgi:hypothetical protein
VGQDGTVYVVTRNGGAINLDSYSSCKSGLVQNHNQTPVANFNTVVCPVPGLDRCNNGNVLSSPTIAVDDKNANHLYVAYATNTAANNENIMVLDSPDGGTTWNTAVQINGGGNARRFMPWVCAVEGKANVAWFDRRNATAANNDLTDYFGGSASVIAGTLTAGTEFRISTASDPQCSTWPCAPRATADSESCSVQPQLAGVCCAAGPNCPGSRARCDFSSGPACPNAGETCSLGGGCPKYGDYNGSTCAFGRFYTIWPSATSQPGAIVPVPPGNIDLFFNAQIIHAPPTAKCKDVTVSAGATCTASASIDNGSFDPDGEAVTLTQSPPGPYSLGPTLVTLTVTDTLNVSATCTGTVTVKDTTPPVVASSVATSQLWPPSHDLQNVGLAASATDNCTPNPVIAVKAIYSTEPDLGPDADSNFSPDAKNIGIGTLRLRSERPGGGQRIYLNVVQATDGSGNIAYSCTAVTVPQSQSAADQAAVQTQAAADVAFCNAHNGAVPAGYVQVGGGPVVGPKQ